jgi:hypothetical protein
MTGIGTVRSNLATWDKHPFCRCGSRIIIGTWDIHGDAKYGRRYFKCPDLDPDFVVGIYFLNYIYFMNYRSCMFSH